MMAIPIARYLVQFGAGPPAGPPGDRLGEPAQEEEIAAAAEEDRAREIEAAHARGSAEGQAAAQVEFDHRLAEERIGFEARMERERARWVTDEGNTLKETLDAAFKALEASLAGSVNRILEPFLGAALRGQVVQSLRENLSVLLSSDRHGMLRIAGPQDLLTALSEGLAPSSKAIEYLPNEAVDVTIVADQTVVESQLQAWISRFNETGG
jgi:hypothetical protein